MVDLQKDKAFNGLGVELLSISPDPIQAWRGQARQQGITLPLLSDAGNRVATAYGVMKWAMPSNEPGHTFVLIDRTGRIAWVRDYGGMEHGGVMYVPPTQLTREVAAKVRA